MSNGEEKNRFDGYPGAEGRKGKKPPVEPYKRGPFNWVAIMLLMLLVMFLLRYAFAGNTITWNDFENHVEKNHIKSVLVESSRVMGEFNDEGLKSLGDGKIKSFIVNYKPVNEKRLAELLESMRTQGVSIKIEPEPGWIQSLLGMLLPLVLLVAVFYFLFARNLRSGAGGMLMSFGRSKHRLQGKDKVKITFKDVAGIDEAKDEVAEIIEFLKHPKKFQRLGGRIPRGVLLIGPPGCGKTLLAKAIAGQADVPFYSISGSDFVEMFVGVGASRVRDLFKQAKENSPCIIFLDEIDAIGRKRGASFVGGANDEREQTLNAILVEMDGFDTNDQVIVIAATNRADILDGALTRPGRFDRQVVVPLPDLKGRLEILQVHVRKVKIAVDADLERLARGTPMFSGADLAAIINEAAIAATMTNKDYIETEDLEEARDKVRWGRARKSRVIDAKDKELTAWHEAGHTIVQSLLKEADPLHKVSIIPRGPFGGATFALPEKDRLHYTKSYCMAMMQVCFGGRIAEEMHFNDISSGAQMDIQQATEIARQMVTTWGMSSKLGPISYMPSSQKEYYLPGDKDYSDKTAETIDQEIKSLVDEAYQKAKEVIEQNKERLEGVANALLKYETLDAADVEIILQGKELEKPTVRELLIAEQAKSGDKPSEESPGGERDKKRGKPA